MKPRAPTRPAPPLPHALLTSSPRGKPSPPGTDHLLSPPRPLPSRSTLDVSTLRVPLPRGINRDSCTLRFLLRVHHMGHTQCRI